MELRKKSILIALVLGDGCICKQTRQIKNKVYNYYNLEVGHSSTQSDYVEWKAELCRKLTGRKCNIREKIVPERVITGEKATKALIAKRFTCCHKYFRVLYKWLYPKGLKVLSPKYLNYLDLQGLAIWYMDDGSTYLDKRNNGISAEIYTHTPLEETKAIIEFFKEKWDIEFHLHKKPHDQWTVRCFGKNAIKFLNLIRPFVPQCMEYKVKIPNIYLQECTES